MSSVRDSSGRRNTIGILLQRVGVRGCGITELFIDGIATECASHKRGQVFGFFTDPNDFRKFINGAHRAMVDGFIVGGVFRQELIGDMVGLQRSGVPVVTAYAHPVHRALVNVGADQVGIARVATEHLISRGCREIVHLLTSDARLIGYRQALRAHRISARSEWVYRGNQVATSLSAVGGEAAIEHFLLKKISFDGVVATSDHQAMGAIRGLLKAGRRVPEDVKVIGVDNSPLCEAGIVTLSSISDDVRLRGRLAVRALMDLLRGRSVKSMSLDPMLCIRESTGG
jgi:DNA-binding LacI/PurR family transcriptional regulator